MNAISAFANGTFDPGTFNTSEYGMNAFEMQYVYKSYKDAPLHPYVLKYWKARDVKKKIYDLGNHGRVYSVLSPLQAEMGRSYPVIYCYHDSSDDIFCAETYGYSDLIAKEKLICVYPEYHLKELKGLEDDFRYIMHQLEENGYAVDRERIYVTGFGYGASASAKLTVRLKDRLAGTGLVCGAHIFRGSELAGILKESVKESCPRQALICIGGKMDGKNIWPLEEDAYITTFNQWMLKFAQAENYQQISLARSQDIFHNSEDRVKREFGLDFDHTWMDYMEGTYWYCGQYENVSKVPVARFISVEGLPHIHCKNVAVQVWEYLRRFRRDPAMGTLEYIQEKETQHPF